MLDLEGRGAPNDRQNGKPVVGDLIVDTTFERFRVDVIDQSAQRLVLVDFWAPWCGPCKQLTPTLEKVVKAARGKVALAKMDIDKYPQIPGQMGIQSIPAVIAFQDGRPADGFMGALPESEIVAFVERFVGPLGPDVEAALVEGEAALAEGDADRALVLFSSVLREDPAHLGAVGGLTRALIAQGELDAARDALAAVPPGKEQDKAILAARAALDLVEQASKVGDITELLRRIVADPRDFEARFDLALGLNARGKRQDAATQLLDIFKMEPTWRDGAARQQLLQFFEAWGPVDPATTQARRKLSALLFA